MKRLLLILLVATLSSCGLFKQVHKEKQTLKTEVSQTDKKDSSSVTVDKTITTVKEKVDTSLIIPAKVIKQETYANMDSLIDGMTAVKNDLVDISLVLNPVTHILSTVVTLKPQKVDLKIDKQTTTQNNITQAGKVSEKIKSDSKLVSSNSVVDKKPVNIGIYIAGAFLIIVAAASIIYWLKNRV